MKENYKLRYSVVVILLLFVFGIQNVKAQVLLKEGQLEYTLHYDVLNPSISKKLVEKYYGTKIITYYKKGSFRDEYYNPDGQLVRVSILNLKKKVYYVEYAFSDTIYYTPTNETNYNTSFSQLNDTVINDVLCWGINSKSVHEQDNDDEAILVTFYKSKELRVKPRWYRKYTNGAYNKILKVAPGITHQAHYYDSDFTKTKTLVMAKQISIKNYLFKLSSNKPLKLMD